MRDFFIFRVRLITIGIFVLGAVLIGRLYMVQIVQGSDFSHRADRQYVRPNQNLYDRGSLFFEDKDGNLISGATLKLGFTVAMNPKELENATSAFQLLNPFLSLDSDTFFLRSGKKDDPYEEIARRVGTETGKAIDALGISGINIYREQWRYYPGERLAAHTLGFVGSDGDTLSGRYGLERYYEDVLNREENSLYINFFAEIFAGLNRTLFDSSAQRAGHVVTSLEPSVQLFLEDTLLKVRDTWNAKQVAGVIIDPQTGAIHALGVYPTFDLNAFSDEENISVFSNPIVESVFEMGSIIKSLTMAAGLDAGAVTADTTYFDEGSITLNGSVISNFDGKGRGRVSMQEVLSESLNTGAVFVVSKMGNDTFAEYMLAYGIGEETGIDLPNESAGLVSNLDSPRDLEYATAAFGQGIAMTPIATVRALGALANGGVLVTPHIAKKILYESGLSKTIAWDDGPQVLKKESAEEITRMLVHVVDTALLGGTVAIPEYSIAAKTGTAQIAKRGERGYYEDRFFHSFFGYFPAYDARFLVFLYALEPKGVRYASQTLTRPFMDITKFLINYYEIPPDR